MARIAVAGVLAIGSVASADPLELRIDVVNGTLDWIDGSMITLVSSPADNRFGSLTGVDVIVTSPLAVYSGPGVLNRFDLHVSADGLTIEGLGLFTSIPATTGSTLTGDAAGPTAGTYSVGDFSVLENLTMGSYELTRFESWDDNVRISVVPAPAGTAMLLGAASLLARRRR